MIDYEATFFAFLERFDHGTFGSGDVVEHFSIELSDLINKSLNIGDKQLLSWVGNSFDELHACLSRFEEEQILNDISSEEIASEILAATAYRLILKDAIKPKHFDLVKKHFRALRDPIYFANLLDLSQTTIDYIVEANKPKRVSKEFLAPKRFDRTEVATFLILGSDIHKTNTLLMGIDTIPKDLLNNPAIAGLYKAACQVDTQLTPIQLEMNRVREAEYRSPADFALEVIIAERMRGFDLVSEDYYALENEDNPGDLNKEFYDKVTCIRDHLLTTTIDEAYKDARQNSFLYKKYAVAIEEAESIPKLRRILEVDAVRAITDNTIENFSNCLALALLYEDAGKKINQMSAKYFEVDVSKVERKAFIEQICEFTEYNRGEAGVESGLCLEGSDLSNLISLLASMIDSHDSTDFLTLEAVDISMNLIPVKCAAESILRASNPDGVAMAADCFHRRFREFNYEGVYNFSGIIENYLPKVFAHAEKLNPGFLKTIDFEKAINDAPIDSKWTMKQTLRLINEGIHNTHDDNHASNADVSFLNAPSI